MTNFDVKFESNSLDQEVSFGEVHRVSDGGYERGYADGYGKGETAAKAEAEAHNAEILTDCNAVLPTKGVETADTLEQVPQRIGEIPSYADGYNVGLEDGKQAEYDRFWDAYQDYGNRESYSIYTGSFAGAYWNDETFKPKYPIVPVDAYMMFRATGITDLTKEGIVLDFSKTKSFAYAFAYNGKLKKLPLIDMSNATDTVSCFADCGAESLNLIFSENTKIAGNMFSNDGLLVNLTIGGTIGMSISLAKSGKLSNASVQAIIDHLKDFSGATAQTLTLHKDVGNKLTEAQKAAITAKNWTLVY